MMWRWSISPGRRSLLLPPIAGTPGPSIDAPPLDIAHLQEEVNKALGDLLATESLIDACQQKLVSDFSMTLWQNESKTLESIKEAKAQCDYFIKEGEACCLLAIQEVESWRAAQACFIQQSHAKDIQLLEEESFEEERRCQLNFPFACQATLNASPPESHGMLIAPYHLLLGHVPISNLLPFPQEHLPLDKGPSQVFLPSLPPPPGPLPRPKQWHHSPDPVGPSTPHETMSKVTPKGPLLQSGGR